MSDDEFKAAIKGLREAQLDVLGQVALGNDCGHHPRTLEALVKRGLIEQYSEILGGGLPVIIARHDMPIHVHIAWCAWAAKKYPLPESVYVWAYYERGGAKKRRDA